jgi:protoporphyrinogen oxidase
VAGLDHEGGRITGVRYRNGAGTRRIATERVWSTLPITALVRMMVPAPPDDVLEAARAIRFRGMILIYLVIGQTRFTEYDAHYFPELRVPISRLSEPKNYAGRVEPRDRTVLCAELPSNPDQPEWQLSDEELGRRLCDWLAAVGLPVESPVLQTVTRRLGYAYPVYDRDYERHLALMSRWLGTLDGLLTFGRQGLFAHDNTHHTMTMALAAGDCVRPDGGFDRDRWTEYEREFEAHVVED